MVDLAGKYADADARGYVVMQDDAQRQDRRAFIALVRVMRQRDEMVRRGMIYVSDDIFAEAGPDDEGRNGAIARALVGWLADHPAEEFFQLRATIAEGDGVKSVEMFDEMQIR